MRSKQQKFLSFLFYVKIFQKIKKDNDIITIIISPVIIINILIKFMIKFIFVAFIITICKSWWEVGHVLTAAVADIKLRQNPDIFVKFQNLVTSINNLCDQRSQTMIQSASWPDDIKQVAYGMSLWNDWHFINTPYVADATIPIINYTSTLSNSINIVLFAKKVMSLNIDKNSAERALFSRYLIHLAGDIHQPLHSVALFNSSYPKGDLGGNIQRVILLNKTSMNFHSYWDSGAFLFQNQTWFIKRPLNEQNRSQIFKRAQSLLDKYGSQLQLQSKNTDPYHWAEESFKFAQNTTYPHIKNTNIITQEYNNLAYTTAEKRVTLGGMRLAQTVLEIYNQKVDPKYFQKGNQQKRLEELYKNVLAINKKNLQIE